MVTLVVITGILLYIFIGCVVGIVLYKYMMNKNPYRYSDEMAAGAAVFGFFWPVSWLFVAVYIAMKKSISGTVEFISNRIIKER